MQTPDRAVCAREARYALMNAALRAACIARDERDEIGTALWRARADEARGYLRAACGVPRQLELPVAA